MELPCGAGKEPLVDRAPITDPNRITELSEVYEALDDCVELERALGRLTRVDAEDGRDWTASKAQVRRICAQFEQRIEEDA
jgi:hypothetical protein